MQSSAKYLPTRRSNGKILLFILLLLSLYVLENSRISNYILQLFWLGTVVFISQIRNIKSSIKLKHRKSLNYWAFYFALFYIIINLFAGLIGGLGRSPYNHSPLGIITNIVLVGLPLVGREFIRSYLVNSYTKKASLIVFALIGLLMTITSFSINRYASPSSFAEVIQFSGNYFLPELSNNIVASFLVFLGGPMTSIIYLGILEGFHWISPILPDLNWLSTAFIGILAPAFFIIVLYYIQFSYSKQLKKRQADKESPLGWILTSIAAILIIWFAVGVFPIFPSVVATGSMEPVIKPGDVILVEKIVDMEGIDQLEEGDIIIFKRENVFISHRITEIINDNTGIKFKTRGDNNTGVDIELVVPQDIRGIIRYTVPKVGWPTLLLKSDKDIDLEGIEF